MITTQHFLPLVFWLKSLNIFPKIFKLETMKNYLIATLFLIPFTLQANLVKFPLYKMGVKFDKNETYFLATPETVNEIKREFFENTEVCESSRNSLDIALSNESFQVFYNENNYNEKIQFAKTPLFIINEENSQGLKEIFQEQCLVVKGD